MKNRILLGLAITFALGAVLPAFAQTQPEVSFADDFQSYGTQKNPPGWVDTSVGSSKPAANGLYKTWPDPLQGNQATNIVYGTKQSSGKPDGNNPRIGTFSTLTTKSFSGKGRFEYRGRFIRTNTDTRIGFSFFSTYPETDHYYLLGLWHQATGTALTMQLFSFGAGALTGTVDTNFTPLPDKWYHFAIQAEDVDGATVMRAHFWLDGDTEPTKWSIDAKDSTAVRLTGGRIGVWSAVKGDAYIDDLTAQSPVDHTPPVITFIDGDTNKTLDPAVLALFKTPARINVQITDQSTISSKTIKLDGADYTPLTPIAVDGMHTMTVHAVDSPGNAADATLNLLVDTKPPVITLLIDTATFTNGQVFSHDVTLDARVVDISKTKTTSTLDNSTVTLPLPVAGEALHTVTVASEDQVGWTSSATSTFYVDKSDPVITIFANGAELTDNSVFQSDVALSWDVKDLTLNTVVVKLDDNTITAPATVTAEGVHTISITATDKANHSKTLTRTFPYAKGKPGVQIIANNQPFTSGTAFNQPVAFKFIVTDPTPTTKAPKVDGANYVELTAVSAEGAHTVYIKVTNAVGQSTEVGPLPFTIDLTKPTVKLTESGTDFTNGMKFARDVNPVVTTNDNLTAAPEKHLLVDGKEYPLATPITSESADHTIEATARDAAGNSATTGVLHFILDKTKPVVTITDGDGKPFAADGSSLFNHAVTIKVSVVDITNAPPVATLNNAPLMLGNGVKQSDGSVVYVSAPIAADNVYSLSVVATDEVGLSNDAVTASFRIDTTPPAIAFTHPDANSTVSTPTILVQGTSDDAISVVVNGRDATVDTTAKTFMINDVALLEGRNEIVAKGTDLAKNSGSATLVVFLDTRAPEVSVATPPANACLNATSVTVSGRATDPNLKSVTVSISPGAASAGAARNSDGTWSATLPLASEGTFVIQVTADDNAGHAATATVPVTVDRTKPVIEVNESGSPFTGGFVNHAVTPIVHAIDAGSTAAVSMTLNGHPYAAGTAIATDGAYTLTITAGDCAGNSSNASIDFTIDTKAPNIVTLDPTDGSTIGTTQKAITGTLDADDVQSVVSQANSLAASVNGRNFTLNAPLTDGLNRFVLVTTDKAGNSSTKSYSFNVKSTTPAVEIIENGSPIAPNQVFTRAVTPVIRSNESTATIHATLDNAAFTSGTAVTTEGAHTVKATASDAYGHTSPEAIATFSIDHTAPSIQIVTPASNATINAAQVAVQGTTTGSDVDRVTVNNITATLGSGTFAATIPLEVGVNTIVAVVYDHAGNSALAQVDVTRDDNRPGLVLTAPANNMRTNRGTIVVAGQVLTPLTGAKVTINDGEVPVDDAGAFRKTDHVLHEGDNAITAAIKNSDRSITVHVIADFTPPSLTVMGNGSEMSQGARYATSPAITLDANDNNPGVTTTLIIDGAAITGASPLLANGGHALTATATDAFGNQVRVDRTFSVGASASGASGCALTDFDPKDGAAIFANSVKFTGQSGTAANVLVNGVRALLDGGSFSASLQLNQEGANSVTIACADVNGVATNDPPKTITLYRYLSAPSITIDQPRGGDVLTTTSTTVTGTVSADFDSGDVNGIPFTAVNGTYSVPNVTLAKGLNIITARAKNKAGRVAVATVNVIVLNVAPAIAITSPLPATQTSATTIDVSGTYTNADPSTITVTAHGTSGSVTKHAASDTTGTFIATNVSLTAASTTTITATARNRAGTQVSASVDVQNVGGPSITITSPADNTFYPSTATAPDDITGTINAADGSTVQVNGTPATVTGNQFTATIGFSSASNGVTPVIARVTTLDGQSAVDAIRVTRYPSPLSVVANFPELNAVGVPAGTVINLVFSHAIDGNTARNAVTLATDGGQTITGTIFVDAEALSFAPQVALDPGTHYTLTVSLALKDLAGSSLASPFSLPFTTATTAPLSAPQLDESDAMGCFVTQTIHGTASVPGARVRLDFDGQPTTTQAGPDRKFSFTFSFSGQPGFHIARVREIGADGSLSPERTITYRVNCAGPQVIAASLDRTSKKLTIQFSVPMSAASLVASDSGTILLRAGTAAAFGGSVALNSTGDVATVTYTADLSPSLVLTVTHDAKDANNVPLAADYVVSFDVDDAAPAGKGYISGSIYDASSGRPLENAHVVITPTTAGPMVTNVRGHYVSNPLAEGAYTIEASATGFTTVWRQVVVPSGVGIVPIDIRLTKRGLEQSSGSDLTLRHGGDTAVTKAVEVFVPAAAVAPGHKLTLTSVGGQSLAGLLPLGWSPLAAAEVNADGGVTSLPASRITFIISAADASAIAAANQTLSVVQYDNTRDEWRTIAAVATIAAGDDASTRRVTADITSTGNYALVYPDNAAKAVKPIAARNGAALQGVANPCSGVTTEVCHLTSSGFVLNPQSVAPSGRTTATLSIAGADKSYPSGTAVQAYIDEQLNYANGTVRTDPPFATDLLIYRNPAGDTSAAVFHLAPTVYAMAATLRDGVDHIRVVEYPGRIDRGSLIGAEGGRIPGDDTISIELPQGATLDSLHATTTPMTASQITTIVDAISSDHSIAGFHVAAGFTLALARTNLTPSDIDGDGKSDPVPVTLLKPARGTFTIANEKFTTANQQVIIAEVLDTTPYGAMLRLAATTSASSAPVNGSKIFTTNDVDALQLPVDGIVRDGRYLVLTADAPVAFAWGRVRLGSTTGPSVSSARVASAIGAAFAAQLGVFDLTRTGGSFSIPVAAQPASPFALRGRSVGTGEGLASVFASSPAPNANVPFGDLVVTAQPPTRVTFVPNNAEVSTDAFIATATFDVDIDRQSAKNGGMTVNNLTLNEAVNGTVDAVGPVVTFTAASALTAGSRYSISIAPSIKSTAGAAFGQSASAQFTTKPVAQTNYSIHPEKIQITIPVNGISTIRGTAGALPPGDLAFAVRRGKYFIELYQIPANQDGSFSFNAGKSIGDDVITTSDTIDLRVLDAVSKATVAVLPLTPFVSADGMGFIAPTGVTTTFTTAAPLNATITVPAGAFDVPTLVHAEAAAQSDFASVPSVNEELGFYGAISLEFDGIAKKPLDVDIPAPAGLTADGHNFVLTRLCDTGLGKRLEVDDLLSIVGGQFTTRATSSTSSLRIVSQSKSVGRNETLVGGQVRDYLIHIIKMGKYQVSDVRTPIGSPLGWVLMDGIQTTLDIFWSLYHSLTASEFYLTAGHGRVVIPVVSNAKFVVQGVDAASGIKLFEHAYDGVPPAVGGGVVGIPSLENNIAGPHPVFGDPFEIEVVEIAAGVEKIDSIPGVKIDTSWATSSDNGVATVTFTDPAPSDPPRHLQVLNPRTGDLSADSSSSAYVSTKVGDQLIVMISSERVEPRSDISVVFNEAISIPTTIATQNDLDAYMRTLFSLQQNVQTSGSWSYVPVDAHTTFKIDSGARRVLLHADLQSGSEYKLHLSPEISDIYSGTGGPLKLGQIAGGSPLSGGLDLYFAVRKPKGDILSTTGPVKLPDGGGTVRDIALDGNLLFVSATDGGLYAYDASNPAKLSTYGEAQFAHATAPPTGTGESWSVQVDNHGRVWTTALTGMFGVVRTFRTEDFIDNMGLFYPPAHEVTPYAGGTLSWRTGVMVGVNEGIDTVLLSDRPEATPRKMQIVSQDDSLVATGGSDLDTKLSGSNAVGATGGPGGTTGEFMKYSIGVPMSNAAEYPYLTQRVTIRNLTLGARWSKDVGPGAAMPGNSVNFDNILVRAGDKIQIDRNLRTYGVVSLFGYGVGVYDLNAIESNSRYAQNPSVSSTYKPIGTLVDLTDAKGKLTFTPDAIVLGSKLLPNGTDEVLKLTTVALLPAIGIDVIVATPKSGLEANGPTTQAKNPATGMPYTVDMAVDITTAPTLKTIKTLVGGAPYNHPFFGRFNSIARYVNDNHYYALVSGGQYGLLILDMTQAASPSLVDVIWSSKGVFAVRTIGDHYASGVDGEGRSILIDLSHIDESKLPPVPPCVPPPPGTPNTCPYPGVFPSLAAALAGGPNAIDTTRYGTDDPRIVWKGDAPTGLVTTLAPAADPETGLLYAGKILDTKLRVESGIDPHVAFKVNRGDGKLTEVTSIVPLGIQPSKRIQTIFDALTPCSTSGNDTQQMTPCRENASEGAFRIEMTLPGKVSQALGGNGDVAIALESERVIGAVTEQTQDPFPRAHLRQHRKPMGSISNEKRPVNFALHHVLTDVGPDALPPDVLKYLRLQKAYNYFISPWVIAIADPRASSQYQWDPNAKREDAGCFQCTPPPFLASPSSGKTIDKDFFEIYTLGRYLTVRPEVVADGSTVTLFDGAGDYKYLGDRHRVFARIGTVPADTVRPANVLIGQAPPLATGALLGTVYLHSGETSTATVDLNAGGRRSWDVVFDRTYRSRTLGMTPYGFGWDGTIFQRLRPLPTGDVEYRDGSGEVWLFRLTTSGYQPPKGFFKHLVHTEQGWSLIDQKRRVTFFDDLGRVTKKTDEFWTPDGNGNAIRYVYDADGRLGSIGDPNDRVSKLTYWDDPDHEGLLEKVEDWHTSPQRKLKYIFDDKTRLITTELPKFTSVTGNSLSPKRKYDYDTNQTGSYKDKIELATNLTKIIDPNEVGGTEIPRIEYQYGGPVRDTVRTEKWGTGESADYVFTVDSSNPILMTNAQVTDVLHQVRHYTFKTPPTPAAGAKLDWYSQARNHIDTMTEDMIEVSTAPFGQLPAAPPVPLSTPPTTVKDKREYKFSYNTDDTLKDIRQTDGWQKQLGYASLGEDLGSVMNSVTASLNTGSMPASRIAPNSTPSSSTVQLAIRSSGAFIDSITADGQTIEAHQPERNTLSSTNSNSVTSNSSFDPKTGLPLTIQTSGGNATCSSGNCGSSTTIHYPPPSMTMPAYKRSLPDYISYGSSGLQTLLIYDDENTAKVKDPRGVTEETNYDEWGREKRVVTTSSSSQQLKYEVEFDENGRVHLERRLQGSDLVTTTYGYDVIGRVTSTSMDHVAALGNPNSKLTQTDDYTSFASGTIIHNAPSGSVTTTTIDKLGRQKKTVTTTGSGADIVSVTAYDIANNPVYQSDTRVIATTMAYDASRRLTDAQHADGSKEHFDYDGFGRVTRMAHRAKNDAEISFRQTSYRGDGQIDDVTEGGSGSSRTVSQKWDGAGRSSGVSVTGSDDPRGFLQEYDDLGRLQSSKSGIGSATDLTDAVMEAKYSGYSSGYLPTTLDNKELKGSNGPAKYTTSFNDYDTAGRPTNVSVGNLTRSQQFDQAGHLTSLSLPNRPAQTFSRDSAGHLTTQTLPDGKTQTFDYGPSGAGTQFNDPKNEATHITPDLLGRPTRIDYPDGTSKIINYNGDRVSAVKDRQDRWQSFVYENGHLTELWATQNGKSSDLSLKLDAYEYDDAGRIVAMTNPDVRIDLLALTFDGKPQHTRQTRYKNHKGLQNPTQTDILDIYDQNHNYNGLGERTFYTIPPGAAPGFAGSATLHYDAMGNVKSIQLDDGLVMNADFRGPGRPNKRDLSLPAPAGSSPKILRRVYGYYEKGQLATGQTQEMRASVFDPSTGSTIDVAGSNVSYDGLQINDVQLIGVSGGARHTRYTYDARGRVSGFAVAMTGASAPPPPGGRVDTPGTAAETPDDSDFRAGQTRAPLFDFATASALKRKGIDTAAIDPPGMSATALPGHKIASITRGSTTRTMDYGGKSELVDDGVYIHHYDVKGRLVWVMEKPATTNVVVRRVVYAYDGRNRLVGRTSQNALIASLPLTDVEMLPWQTETRADVLGVDGLPAETTFVWDPVADRLMSIVRTGASFVSGDPGLNIVKQFVHGELRYDDPIQITTIDSLAPAGSGAAIRKLYPVYDEAGSASLQVVLNNKGEVVARSITSDPYGGTRFDLAAAAVDHVEVTASKDPQGNLKSVVVSMRATEQVAASTVANGARLAVVDANGNLVRTSTATATVDENDAFTIRWTLGAADWSALSNPAPVVVGGVERTPISLSIGATNSLRASVWATDITFLAAPAWATVGKPIYTSSTMPIEVRESLTNLSGLVDSLQPGETKSAVSFDVPSLTLLGSATAHPDVATLFSASFQAQPFTEPFTHTIYVRERWYDPTLGVWLTPDPAGYRDSSNMYAFAGGDPINRRDPTGRLCESANASGFLDWLSRCTEDALTFGGELVNSLTDGHQLERMSGAANETLELVGQTVWGGVTLAWDLSTASFNDDAADRLVARFEGAADFVEHPWESIKKSHEDAFDAILDAESRGDYKASGAAAASIAQQDYLMVDGAIGATKLAVAGGRFVAGLLDAGPILRLGLTEAEMAGVGEAGEAASPKFIRCFPPGTQVLMADGSSKAIEQIGAGDRILGDDPADADKPSPFVVAARLNNHTDHLVTIEARDAHGSVAHFRATREHPFWVKGGGWKNAQDLTALDVLSDKDGGDVHVISATVSDEKSPTYNLTVDARHTFFIADHGVTVLVHNATEFQVGTMRSLTGKMNRWDGMDAHEALQHAYLKAIGHTEGRSGDVYLSNPAIALKEPMHDEISAMQQEWGLHDSEYLKTLTPEEVVHFNYEMMLEAGVPEAKALELSESAYRYATETLGISCP